MCAWFLSGVLLLIEFVAAGIAVVEFWGLVRELVSWARERRGVVNP